jgi:hypothetical protein
MRAEPATMEGRPQIAPGTWTPTDTELDELLDPSEAGTAPDPNRHDGQAGGGLTLEDLTERG